jgi:head-tail adaptor
MPYPAFDPSRYRHRLTILEPPGAETAQDDHGQPTGPWNEVGAYWCALEAVDGEEVFDGGKPLGRVSVQIEMRYDRAITHKMRGEMGGRVFLFASVLDPDGGMKVRLLIRAIELQPTPFSDVH